MIKNTSIARKFSAELGRMLAWIPVEPNIITICSIFLAFFGFIAHVSAFASKEISLLFFILAFVFDAIDGAVARAKGKTTKQGAFIDGIADRIVEFFLLLTILRFFVFDYFMQSIVLAILFFGTCMTAFVKAYAEHQGLLPHETAVQLHGLLERFERSLLLLSAFVLLILGFMEYGVYVLYLTAVLSIVTFVQRFFIVLSSS
jgi:phosphatidylglycerophosphate synthase